MYYSDTVEERDSRRKELLQELNDLISLNTKYIKYLQTLGNVNELSDFSAEIKKLKVIYASFMMLLWKDDYLLKSTNKRLSSNLSNELLNDVISLIAKKNMVTIDGEQEHMGWFIGDILLLNNYDVIDKVRNKLAHGDYTIEDNFIVFDIDKRIGKVDIDSLVQFTNILGTSWESLQITGENKLEFMTVNLPEKHVKKISHTWETYKFINSFRLIELTDRPSIGKIRTKEYIELMDKYRNALKDITEKPDEYNEIVREFSKAFETIGINMSITATPAKLLPNIKEVYESFKKNKTFFKEPELSKQLQYIATTILEKNTDGGYKRNISNGITNNQNFLFELSDSNNKTVRELLNVEDKITLDEKTMLGRTLITSYLVGFYVVYIYGLDNIYTAYERDHIDKIYENKMFNFAKLDLHNVKYKKLKVEKDFTCFIDQFKSNKKKNEELQKNFFEVEKNYKQIEKRLEEETDELERQRLKNQLRRLKDLMGKQNAKYQQRKEKIKFEKQFIENEYDTYKKNRSIIEHIRNSISHGNIKMNYMQGKGEMKDATIFLQDVYEDEITFEAKIKIEDFLSLISGKNIEVLTSYLDDTNKAYETIPPKEDEVIPNMKKLKL